MKQTVKNFYYRLIALDCLATRKRFYLFATNGKGSRTIETYNIDLKEFRIYFECRRNGFTLTLQGLIIEKIDNLIKDHHTEGTTIHDDLMKIRDFLGGK